MKLIKLRVCNVLKNWVDNFFSDFSKNMIEKLLKFIDDVVSDGYEQIAAQLKESLLQKVSLPRNSIDFLR